MLVLALAGLGSTALAACGDNGLQPSWTALPDTALLFTLARPELNLPSAFSFRQRRTYRVEGATSTGSWDIALDTEGGELVLLPPGALGISSRAAITTLPGMDFDQVEKAPTDSAVYKRAEPVPAELGLVYVVRTGEVAGTFGSRCVYFAKMEPVEMDSDAGTLSFLYDANPFCNDNRLVPPGD